LAFHQVERLDVVRMVKLFIPLEEEAEFVSPTKEVAELVMASFRRNEVEPQVTEVIDRIELFEGLDDPDVLEIAGLFHVEEMSAETEIFKAGDPSDEMWIILSGEVKILVPGSRRVGKVGPGECLGETALLTRTPHSANAVATTAIEAAVVRGADLEALVRRRPSTGVVLYRNLALGLGSKLRRTGRGGRG
jgi:CRP-like cAMP-binding protein